MLPDLLIAIGTPSNIYTLECKQFGVCITDRLTPHVSISILHLIFPLPFLSDLVFKNSMFTNNKSYEISICAWVCIHNVATGYKWAP